MAAVDKHARTEQPTPKRKKEARDKGQVARSVDVGGWAAVVVGSFVLPWYLTTAKGRVVGVMAQTADVARAPSAAGALVVLEAGLRVVGLTVLPLGAALAVLGIVTGVAQTGRVFSFKAARPKLSRVSPKAGLQRLLSANTGVQLLKQLVKLVALTGIAYKVLSGLIRSLIQAEPVSLLPVLSAAGSQMLTFVRAVAVIGLVIGLADYLFQRHRLTESLKMTKEEVKEERRAADGDPFLKGALKRRMYAISRTNLVRAVRRADVVVTNPTHYAVALQYETGRAAAPRVVAKGADLLAQRIKREAAAFEVPIVEDPPLARYLYALCEVDEQIPGEIYLAVAKLLAFVYSLPAALRGVGVHRRGPSSVPVEPAAMATLSEEKRLRVAAMLAGRVAT